MTGILQNAVVTATFSKDMDGATVTGANFSLMNGATPISGTVSYSAAERTMTFTPDDPIPHSSTLTATVTTGVTDNSTPGVPSRPTWCGASLRWFRPLRS